MSTSKQELIDLQKNGDNDTKDCVRRAMEDSKHPEIVGKTEPFNFDGFGEPFMRTILQKTRDCKKFKTLQNNTRKGNDTKLIDCFLGAIEHVSKQQNVSQSTEDMNAFLSMQSLQFWNSIVDRVEHCMNKSRKRRFQYYDDYSQTNPNDPPSPQRKRPGPKRPHSPTIPLPQHYPPPTTTSYSDTTLRTKIEECNLIEADKSLKNLLNEWTESADNDGRRQDLCKRFKKLLLQLHPDKHTTLKCKDVSKQLFQVATALRNNGSVKDLGYFADYHTPC